MRIQNATLHPRPLTQYAALPVRVSDRRGIEVLLITSRRAGRWIIPKGWPKRGLSPHATAAAEAFEEAGVVGLVEPRSIGSFTYVKSVSRGDASPCCVDVFVMQVTEQLAEWPERQQRRQLWCSPARAIRLVEPKELGDLIRLFAQTRLAAS